MKDQNDVLERLVAERTQELTLTQDVTIQSLASLAETRDNETGDHIQRTRLYVGALARYLSTQPGFEHLDDRTVELLFKSTPLHDIGKVGIADRILLKPDQLTAEEFDEMKTHTTLGRDALLRAEEMLGTTRSLPPAGQGDRLRAPREVGRQRLSGRDPRRGDPAPRPPHGRRRRLRRSHLQAPLQVSFPAREGGGHHHGRQRQAFRPGHGGRVPGLRRGVPRDRVPLQGRLRTSAELDLHDPGRSAEDDIDDLKFEIDEPLMIRPLRIDD